MLLGLYLSFKENNFFSNETLSVTLEFEEGVVKEIIGSKIEWEEGRDVTVKKEKQSVNIKKTGEIKTTTKTVPTESFFNIF
jgi:nucleosome assembly protein 1-like 1